MNTFGDNLKKAIEAKKMTYEEVGEKLGKGKQTISNWANAVSKPSHEDLINISNLLEVSIDWLLTGHEPKKYEIPAGQMMIASEDFVEYMTLKNKALKEENTQQEAEIERLRKAGETATKH